MAKTQITLGTEMQRRARQRASDLGVSLAEYFRRLVARDLARPETATDVDRIFDQPEGFRDRRGLSFHTQETSSSLALSRYEPICRHLHLVCRCGLFRPQQRSLESDTQVW
jgi:hypothetical protein